MGARMAHAHQTEHNLARKALSRCFVNEECSKIVEIFRTVQPFTTEDTEYTQRVAWTQTFSTEPSVCFAEFSFSRKLALLPERVDMN